MNKTSIGLFWLGSGVVAWSADSHQESLNIMTVGILVMAVGFVGHLVARSNNQS